MFIKKKSFISGPVHFIPVVFKDQLWLVKEEIKPIAKYLENEESEEIAFTHLGVQM